MKFRELRKQVLSEEIVKEILSMIESGEIGPGDKLPPERELAATLNVSRPSLREALRALAIMNVIEIAQGDGIYVTTLEPELLAQHLEFIFSLEDSTFLQLFEARRIVEAGCAELAAERAQDDDISAIESILVESIDSVDDADRFLQIDIRLHDRIAQIADNPMLSRFMASISRLSRASRSITTDIPGVRGQSAQDHRAIVEAIAARNPEAARQAMLQHLRHVEGSLKEVPHAAPQAHRPQVQQQADKTP